MAKKTTYRRRPNNSGTVSKLSGKRRKPYIARVFSGKYNHTNGEPIRTVIGYFETEQEALNALALYNMSNQIDKKKLEEIGGETFASVMANSAKHSPTFKECYKAMSERKFESITTSRISALNSAFNKLTDLHNKPIGTIGLFDIQAVFDRAKEKVKSKTLNDMKSVCVRTFEYAIIHQYISRDQDFTSYIDVKPKLKTEEQKHQPFTIDEIKKIMANEDIVSKTILVYIFTGCRPNELMGLEEDKIKDGYLVTGSKTEAGRDRIIPIVTIIKPFINEVLLFLREENTNTYRANHFIPLMVENNMSHLPYDTRHTYATLAKSAKMDDYIRKKIMGHKSNDITDDVYTHAYADELCREAEKICYQFVTK